MPIRSIYDAPGAQHQTAGVPAAQNVRNVNAPPGSQMVMAPPIETVWTSCQAKTTQGQPCKAHPAKGTKYCVGHLRKFEPEKVSG